MQTSQQRLSRKVVEQIPCSVNRLYIQNTNQISISANHIDNGSAYGANPAPPAVCHSQSPDNHQPQLDGQLVLISLALSNHHPLPQKREATTLTTTAVKLLERMIADHLSWYVEDNKALGLGQAG